MAQQIKTEEYTGPTVEHIKKLIEAVGLTAKGYELRTIIGHETQQCIVLRIWKSNGAMFHDLEKLKAIGMRTIGVYPRECGVSVEGDITDLYRREEKAVGQ